MPISSRSAKPCVINNAVLEPFRSSKALVATVVPILILSILCEGSLSFSDRFKILRMPSTTGSEYDEDSERILDV